MSEEPKPALSPAAQRALSTYLENEAQLIRERATAAAESRTGSSDVDLPDLLAALPNRSHLDEVVAYSEFRDRRRSSMFERISRLYFLIGTLTAVLGVSFALYAQFGYLLNQSAAAGIAAAIAGTAIALASSVLSRELSRNRARQFEMEEIHGRRFNELTQGLDREYSATPQSIFGTAKREGREHGREVQLAFISEWIDLETTLRLVAAEKLGDSAAKMGLARMITELVSSGLVEATDAESLLASLRIRNSIVHGGQEDVPFSRIAAQIIEVRRIEDVLRRLI